ncbi:MULTISPECIES: hypothetical protein [unclassified Coleofasciculus]|uniref:hypothetical protein n=1 Tax=unclassified Coleofasciculus TaxID=2692782 RepID=UPI0018814776|nr:MULTISPECIES: hypothetical protein [unclassified Coleofasciculus]MBE9126392.1 hypothetical protein [Coleofasciculus sp. LEGE 07081]MBE9149829.1 hypothetical protein [Coleofasciculus sp. LEGE 07092]
MVKFGAIALLASLYFNSGAIGLATPHLSQPKMSEPECKQLTDIRESPIQMLPEPFENGCVISTPLRANSPGTIVYVLKAEMKLPITSSNRGELRVQEIETLNGLVDTGDAIRITWFTPGTIGSGQFVQSLPEETIFVAWDDLCTKFQSETVGCVESGAFRVRDLVEILIKNKERTATVQP